MVVRHMRQRFHCNFPPSALFMQIMKRCAYLAGLVCRLGRCETRATGTPHPIILHMTDFRFMADKDRISYFDEGIEYRIDL